MTEKNKPTQQEITQKVLNLYSSYTYQFSSLNDKLIKEMLEDPDIHSAWDTRKKCVQAREWRITPIRKEDEKIAKEIELRFSGLNLSEKIGEILDSRIFGKGFHELTWKDDWTYDKMIKEPNYAFRLDNNQNWTFSNGDSIPENKFIISMNEADHENPAGKSLFKPLLKTYQRKTVSYDSINNFIKRFYDIIIWYVYDNTMEEADVVKQLEAFKEVTKGEKTALAIPPGDMSSTNRGLNKDFGFLTMDNFTSDTQQKYIRMAIQEIEMVLKGASFAKAGDTAGSYSKDSVSNEVRNDIIESDVKYLRDILQQLIEIDAYYFGGYDPNLFYFTFTKGEDKLKQAEILQAEETAKKTEAEKLEIVKKLGFDIEASYISERFNIPLNFIKKTETIVNFENEENEFLLKKKESNKKLSDLFYTQLEEEKIAIIKNLKNSFNGSILNSENDIVIDINFSERFEELLILSNLYGMYNVSEINLMEFEEKVNPFKIKFAEAIKYFADKVPVIYEKLDTITAKFREQKFWVKKLTDLELTKKVKSSIQNSLKNGSTFEQWKKSVDLKGLADWYLETVFRTNMTTAYSSGRYEQQVEMASAFKYWLYDAVMDNRTSLICSELDGRIYRSDNPIWNTIYPPLHHGCRSDVIALSDNDIRIMNIKKSSIDNYEIQNSEVYKKFVEKSEFANNPFNVDYQKMYTEKLI